MKYFLDKYNITYNNYFWVSLLLCVLSLILAFTSVSAFTSSSLPVGYYDSYFLCYLADEIGFFGLLLRKSLIHIILIYLYYISRQCWWGKALITLSMMYTIYISCVSIISLFVMYSISSIFPLFIILLISLVATVYVYCINFCCVCQRDYEYSPHIIVSAIIIICFLECIMLSIISGSVLIIIK